MRQEATIKNDSETRKLAEDLLLAIKSGTASTINYKNSCKKDLKAGEWRKFFSNWLAVLRDALLLKSGSEEIVFFPTLKEKIGLVFKDAQSTELTTVANKGIAICYLIESKNVAADKAAEVFLLSMQNVLHKPINANI